MRTVVETLSHGAAAILVHGGAGSRCRDNDGCAKAARAGVRLLGAGKSALDAAVRAVAALENDGRFNAGRGAALRMDGVTIECDAGLMDTKGRLGAVAAIRDAPNPILVARAVADTPHWLLAGEGARSFADRLRLVSAFAPSARATRMHKSRLLRMKDRSQAANNRTLKLHWNFPRPWQEAMDEFGAGTVGAVALDRRGQFAAATSTGGAMPALYGRVGDTPIVGCGFYAGAAGAVAATGVGEYIVRNLLSLTVYRWIESGAPLGEALDGGLALIPKGVSIGLIAITHTQTGIAARSSMAAAALSARRR